MSSNSINFSIDVGGNAQNVLSNLSNTTINFDQNIGKTATTIKKLRSAFLYINQAGDFLHNIGDKLEELSIPGENLNSSMMDLSAVAGVTGKGLKEIEGYARSTAKTFGVDAAQAVESYKLILSQLSPEIAKIPRAMQAMGNSIATLSKTMGGDTTAAAEVLTTAMNQYGVSLDNPMQASKEMARMMNVMAAAGKEGSADGCDIALTCKLSAAMFQSNAPTRDATSYKGYSK